MKVGSQQWWTLCPGGDTHTHTHRWGVQLRVQRVESLGRLSVTDSPIGPIHSREPVFVVSVRVRRLAQTSVVGLAALCRWIPT